MDYVPANKEVCSVVKNIRSKHYSRYKKARIVILMRHGRWDKWGTMQRVGKKQRQAGINGDYILTLNGDAWLELSDKQKKALVDHELLHMKIKKTKNGKNFILRRHDVEEFIEIVHRYGDWTPNLKSLHEVMSKRITK